MRIVCAQSVFRGREAFSTLGETRVLADREIGRRHLGSADALVIRSQTRVGPGLFEGTPLRFVGTATAGFDHMDTAALERAKIRWVASPGCNADSVAEYVAAALLRLARRRRTPLAGRTLGIVGVGEVGRRVDRVARALGLETRLNDPPRREAEPENRELRPLDEVLETADIVTLHVPLTGEAPHATRALASGRFFEALRPGAWFLNAARGEVVDEAALRRAMDSGALSAVALDVWNGEPDIDATLVSRADLATPHIAGYSTDGKLNGTLHVYRELCRHAARTPGWDPAPRDSPPPVPEILAPEDPDDEAALDEIVRRAYDIEADDAPIRAAAARGPAALAAEFARRRKAYPDRREFFHTTVRLARPRPSLAAALRELRFRLG